MSQPVLKDFHCNHCGRMLLQYEVEGRLRLIIRCRRCGGYVDAVIDEGVVEDGANE